MNLVMSPNVSSQFTIPKLYHVNAFLEKIPLMAGQQVLVAGGIAWAAAGILGLYTFIETGKMVHTQTGDFNKGYNVFTIEQQLLKTNGVLFYKLQTATEMATMKMIQAK